MADTQTQSTATPVTEPTAEANTYAMPRSGKRQARVLLIGVASIWIFALWSLIVILDDGITGVEWISSLLMLGMLLVAPVVGWSLLEEASSRYTVTQDGVRYTSMGVNIMYPWSALVRVRPKGTRGRVVRFLLGPEEEVDTPPMLHTMARSETDAVEAQDEDDDPEQETILVELRKDAPSGTGSLIALALHRLAFGDALPVYGNVENRKRLLAAIEEGMRDEPENEKLLIPNR